MNIVDRNGEVAIKENYQDGNKYFVPTTVTWNVLDIDTYDKNLLHIKVRREEIVKKYNFLPTLYGVNLLLESGGIYNIRVVEDYQISVPRLAFDEAKKVYGNEIETKIVKAKKLKTVTVEYEYISGHEFTDKEIRDYFEHSNSFNEGEIINILVNAT